MISEMAGKDRVQRGIEKFLCNNANISGSEVGAHRDIIPYIGCDVGVCKFIEECNLFGFKRSLNRDICGRFQSSRSGILGAQVPGYNVFRPI